MDTSEVYIRQCDCPEIQELRGILAFVPNGSNSICWCGEDTYWDSNKGAIWLPRQDQLQGMVEDRPNHPFDLAYAFAFFCKPMARYRIYGTWVEEDDDGGIAQRRELENEGEVNYPKQFTSMEQLWLAFVLKEKFNKTWDGDKWV